MSTAHGGRPATATDRGSAGGRPVPHDGHRPVWAEVDLDAIRGNAEVLRAHADGALLMAVVKADGYGHGAVEVARAALEGGAAWLGVALVEEGIRLRQAGIDAPVLVFSEPPASSAPAVVDHGLTPTVYTHTFALALREAASRRSSAGPVDVHLKLDTGMRRVGLAPERWEEGMRRLAASPELRVSGIWSHLAVGDVADEEFTRLQGERLHRGVELARGLGLTPDLVHMCNSGGTTLYPELHLDMVRTGIALYGMEAAPGVRLAGLRPAMALRARLSLVKPVAAGETVSYGRRWAPDVDTVVGTVPAGYADGIRRGLTGKGLVTHGGRRHPMAGTVCMDMLMVDLGPGSDAVAGDDVWLLGGPGPDPVTAEEWAAWLDTITYEVTCGIGVRVPRVYV